MPAIPRFHVGHCTELVCAPSSSKLEFQILTRFLSFPVSDIKRTLDAMSWVKVRVVIYVTHATRLFIKIS